LGREEETARLSALLLAAQCGRSGSLLITGEPGIGKTALCQAAIEAADGMEVLTARGVASESELPFAGLTELFRPVTHLVEGLPEAQRAPLEYALALASPMDAAPFAVGVAALSLLAAAAERSPVLCVIDDLQWLDLSSRQALLFAARRLQAERVAMLFASRPVDDNDDASLALPVMPLTGLAPAASASLLAASAEHPVHDEVADALHRSTGGNPLALVEVPALLSPAQLAGLEPLDG
jgi:predicted ATPase